MVWVYDLRANMPQFGKRTPLTRGHFSEFEAFFGDDPNGDDALTSAMVSPDTFRYTIGFVPAGNYRVAYTCDLDDTVVDADVVSIAETHAGLEAEIVVAVDARDGFVATEGWAEKSDMPVIDLARRFEDAGVASILFTDVGRDGMLTGCNIDATVDLARRVIVIGCAAALILAGQALPF